MHPYQCIGCYEVLSSRSKLQSITLQYVSNMLGIIVAVQPSEMSFILLGAGRGGAA